MITGDQGEGGSGAARLVAVRARWLNRRAAAAEAMSAHKFKVGDAVEYRPPRGLYAPPGPYHVTAALPVRLGEFEYRIKHPR
jgi:hypothetical protein